MSRRITWIRASVDVLTDAMIDFPGTIMFISHDPTFLTRICDPRGGDRRRECPQLSSATMNIILWKKAQEFESIKESSEELAVEGRESRAAPTKAMASQTAPKVTGRETGVNLTKTQARLEKQVARAEAEIAEQETKIKGPRSELADPALYQEFSKWNGLHKEQDTWKKELERLTARWESLSSRIGGGETETGGDG